MVSCCGGLAVVAQEANSWDPGSIPGRDTSVYVPESSWPLSGPWFQLDSRYRAGKASQAGTANRAQAEHWQTFPGGTATRSQAGNWQASQAGTASMPRQGMHTGKRSQAGNWQAFTGRELASVPGMDVPRQDTGKCSQAGNRRRPQAGDSGCSQAGNCRHCKRALREKV